MNRFLARMKMSPETFNAFDTLIKVIGIVALVLSGGFAIRQYQEGQQREYRRAFYDRQLTVVADLFNVFTDLDLASTQESKRLAVTKFWMIYQGSGRVFLTPRMYESLNQHPLDYVKSCVLSHYKPRIIPDCNTITASQSVAGFALVARMELANTWSQDLREIGTVDPWVPFELQK